MRSRSNWNLEVLVFEERVRKPEYLEKPLGEENQQQTQPTHGVDVGISTRVTLVGDQHGSPHFANLAPFDFWGIAWHLYEIHQRHLFYFQSTKSGGSIYFVAFSGVLLLGTLFIHSPLSGIQNPTWTVNLYLLLHYVYCT